MNTIMSLTEFDDMSNYNQYGVGYSHGLAAGENETKTELGLLLMELIILVSKTYTHGKSRVILNAVKTALQEV